MNCLRHDSGVCIRCQKPLAIDEVRDCPRTHPDILPMYFDKQELHTLCIDLDDPTLIGNRLKQITDYLGLPPCPSCEKRKTWMNKAHLYVRNVLCSA
jgi:hypothetical protein